jgi:hypothetical protein
MKTEHADILWVAEVRDEHRSWLAYSEIDLLFEFEMQVVSGWSLSTHQRSLVERMVRSAHDRREMAISLSRTAIPRSTAQGGGAPH